MYGAILGDIIGSPYEFDEAIRQRTFHCFLQLLNLRMIPS